MQTTRQMIMPMARYLSPHKMLPLSALVSITNGFDRIHPLMVAFGQCLTLKLIGR